MKVHPPLRVILTVTSMALCVSTSSAVDFGKANPLKWFKAKEENVPTVSEKQDQESAAASLMRDAKTALSTDDVSKALNIYKEIINRYRFTDTAAEAQFEYSKILRSNGKLQDSYEGFQKFIDDYRQSPRFNEALQQQFEIAEEAKAGKKQPSLLLIPMKLDKSELIKLYQGVIKNSPYGKYASHAQFAIGEVYQDDGDKAMANASYQAVVDNYPNTKLASEAQFRIGAISSAAARRTQDASNLAVTRDALQTYKLTNPDGDRSNEAESLIKEVNEAESIRSLEVAEFYEKSNKPKAAAIYYNEALKYGSPEASVKARERLSALAATYPEEMKNSVDLDDADYTIPAAINLKKNPDYAGPPAPLVAKMGRKSEMRMEQDNFKPIPLKEPELPTSPSVPPAPGMILPPATSPKTPLPVPPAPQSLPVPPTPEVKKDAVAPEAAKPDAPKKN